MNLRRLHWALHFLVWTAGTIAVGAALERAIRFVRDQWQRRYGLALVG